jgi:hypothetical protein
MASDVQSAWIAAGASIVVSLVSLGTAIWTNIRADRTQRDQEATALELEKLKSRLSAENDAAKAKRDYEYEARKRLYSELYPLAYQLHQAALHAQHRIANLALATRDGYLAVGPDNWLTGRDPYYFNSVVHNLIAPLAIYELMTRKLTLLDLTLDRELHRLHFIAGKSYEAMRSDFNLVDPRYPPLVFGSSDQRYAPPEVRPSPAPREQEQRWMWRQGLYSGQISQAVDALVVTDGTTKRVMTYAEFAKALQGADLRTADDPGGPASAIKQALRPLVDVLYDFHPARRPVTWRILLAQAACYRAMAAMESGVSKREGILSAARYSESADRKIFDWIGDATRSIPPTWHDPVDFAAEQKSAWAAADLFIESALKDYAGRYKS